MPLVRHPHLLRSLLLAAGSVVAVAGPIRPSVGADLGSAGILVMEQTLPGGRTAACRSAVGDIGTTPTCSTVNLYGGETGGPLVPGGRIHTTDVTITNSGTQSAHGFTIAGGRCGSAPAPGSPLSGHGDLCDVLRVRITGSNRVVVFEGTAATLEGEDIDLLATTGQPGPLAAGARRTYTFEVWLDHAAARPAYRGLEATQSLSWKFTS